MARGIFQFTATTLIPVMFIPATLTYVYVTVGVCSYRIRGYMRSHIDVMSRKTVALQAQLSRMLLVQVRNIFTTFLLRAAVPITRSRRCALE